MIPNPLFAIPPGAANHEVEAEATFTEDVKVWSMHPHMHLRGKDMTYTATYPDGRSEIVLRVPKFDFGWQTDYWLAQPLTLPKGSKIDVTRPLRQLDRQPAQSRSDRDGPLGRSDVGRDDDRLLHLHGGGEGRSEFRAITLSRTLTCSQDSTAVERRLQPPRTPGRSERTGPTFVQSYFALLGGSRCAQDVAHRVVAFVAAVLEQRVVRLFGERERRRPRLRPHRADRPPSPRS